MYSQFIMWPSVVSERSVWSVTESLKADISQLRVHNNDYHPSGNCWPLDSDHQQPFSVLCSFSQT